MGKPWVRHPMRYLKHKSERQKWPDAESRSHALNWLDDFSKSVDRDDTRKQAIASMAAGAYLDCVMLMAMLEQRGLDGKGAEALSRLLIAKQIQAAKMFRLMGISKDGKARKRRDIFTPTRQESDRHRHPLDSVAASPDS